MKLIDEDALVAEIKKLLAFYSKEIEDNKEEPWAMDIAKRDILQEILSFIDTLEVKEVDSTPNIRFPHYKSIVEKVFGAGNLESFEYDEAEQLVSLAKEELLKDLEVKEVDLDLEIALWANAIPEIRLDDVERLATYFFELGLKAQKGSNGMAQDNKDLCKTCKHYWQDFPLPLESVVSHCEILDSKKGLSANMNDEVPYPCLKCPFNSYIKK